MKTLRLVGLLILPLLLTVGCQAVTPEAISGRWSISDRHLLTDEQRSAAAMLELNPNGTFVATGLPADSCCAPRSLKGSVFSASGDWRLVEDDGDPLVELAVRAIPGVEPDELPFTGRLSVSHGWSRPVLYYYQGDPDSGRQVSFEKVN